MEPEKTDSPTACQRIKVTEDGPYLVSGGVPLAEEIVCVDDDGEPHGWQEGRRYRARESYALCRCGQSQQMPYCDGSHVRLGFDGTETAPHTPYLEQAAELDGGDLKLTDAKAYCVGAGFCLREGGTWALTRKSADPRAKQTAIEEACECPSGRLVAWEGDQPIEPEFEPSIALIRDVRAKVLGPIWVRGGIPIESADGRVYEVRNRVTLCNCGRSSTEPFCDGSHRE